MPLRRGMGCIFKLWPDKNVVQGKKSTGGKDREGSFQAKQHAAGFIGSADDLIFFSGGKFWYCVGVRWVMGRMGVSDAMGEGGCFWWG